jgi:hypothetical protein
MDLGLGAVQLSSGAAGKRPGRNRRACTRRRANSPLRGDSSADPEVAADGIGPIGRSGVFWQAVEVGDAGRPRFVVGGEHRFARVDIRVTNRGGPPSNLFGPMRLRIGESGPTHC